MAGSVTLDVFTVWGQRVRTLFTGVASAGIHEVTWDGKDENGRTVGSGVYFYRLVTGQTAIVKNMMLLK
jgi:flagellar hook assembly protein FlgD